MAAFNFPNSPSTNDLHTENSVTWKWDGVMWNRVGPAYTDTTNLNVTGIGTIAGNFHVGGVLTYEDVKNVDSVGIITARSGIDCNGNATFGANGTITTGSNFSLNGNAFTVTGASTVVGEFKKAGSPTIQVTDTTNSTDLQLRADATGGLVRTASNKPLLFGTNQTERLRITSDGKIGIAHHVAGQIAKELTIRPANDGGIRFVRPGETSASPNIHLDLTTTTSGSAFPSGEAYTVKYKTMNCDQIFETYAGGGTGGNISFRTSTSNNSSESLRITSTGNLEKKRGGSYFAYNVNGYYAKQDNYDNSGGKSYWYDGASGNSNIVAYVDGQSGDIMAKGNFVAGTAGKGIDFSATSGGSGGSSEILSDYEQGTFTATVTSSGGGASFASGSQATNCIYIKIGSMVHIQGYLSGVNVSSAGSGITKITGLPFASNNTSYYTISLTHNTLTAQQCTGAYIQYANTYFFPIQIGSTSGSALNQGNPRYMMFGGSYPVQF